MADNVTLPDHSPTSKPLCSARTLPVMLEICWWRLREEAAVLDPGLWISFHILFTGFFVSGSTWRKVLHHKKIMWIPILKSTKTGPLIDLFFLKVYSQHRQHVISTINYPQLKYKVVNDHTWSHNEWTPCRSSMYYLDTVPSGQIRIIPKPELRIFLGDSLTKPPFKMTSSEVVIICPGTIAVDSHLFHTL